MARRQRHYGLAAGSKTCPQSRTFQVGTGAVQAVVGMKPSRWRLEVNKEKSKRQRRSQSGREYLYCTEGKRIILPPKVCGQKCREDDMWGWLDTPPVNKTLNKLAAMLRLKKNKNPPRNILIQDMTSLSCGIISCENTQRSSKPSMCVSTVRAPWRPQTVCKTLSHI